MDVPALPLVPQRDTPTVGVRACRTTCDLALPPRLSLAATRTSRKVSLLQGESDLHTRPKYLPHSLQG